MIGKVWRLSNDRAAAEISQETLDFALFPSGIPAQAQSRENAERSHRPARSPAIRLTALTHAPYDAATSFNST
jgi:hypothetical protein